MVKIIKEEFMDNIEEEYIRSILECQRQQLSTRMVIDWNHEQGYNRLFNDYFFENLVCIEVQFRRRHVFLRFVEALSKHDEYFQMKVIFANGRMGLLSLIGESTAMECLERFVKGVNDVFGVEYLRRPNNNDINCLLQRGETRDFLGMLGSID
ncbi:hypothetical protein CR513_51009, partial [Mucuna pruriens]